LREQVSERDFLFGRSELEFSAGRFAQDLEILKFDEVVRDGRVEGEEAAFHELQGSDVCYEFSGGAEDEGAVWIYGWGGGGEALRA